MKLQAGAHTPLMLLEALVMLSSTPLLVRAQDVSCPSDTLRCPSESVKVGSNGSLMFRPLSPGSDNPDPVYDPGAIGGWYSLAAGFVDVVRPGTLPYGEWHDTTPSPPGHSSHFTYNIENLGVAGRQGYNIINLLWWWGLTHYCPLQFMYPKSNLI